MNSEAREAGKGLREKEEAAITVEEKSYGLGLDADKNQGGWEEQTPFFVRWSYWNIYILQWNHWH